MVTRQIAWATKQKVGFEKPSEYFEALERIPPQVKKPMERLLEMFIATR